MGPASRTPITSVRRSCGPVDGETIRLHHVDDVPVEMPLGRSRFPSRAHAVAVAWTRRHSGRRSGMGVVETSRKPLRQPLRTTPKGAAAGCVRSATLISSRGEKG